MTELAWLIAGLLIGCFIGVMVMCCLQINRINDYEAEIQRLKDQLNKEQKNKIPNA